MAEGMHVRRPGDEKECGEFGKLREVLLLPKLQSPSLPEGFNVICVVGFQNAQGPPG